MKINLAIQSFFCVLMLLLSSFWAEAQAPATSPEIAIKSKAEDVLLDVVVRNKKGHLVTDLKPEDFRILDNGSEKKIVSFRLVQGGEALASGGTRTQLDPLQQLRLVTMIFQCSSNNARKLARDSALDFLKGELQQNVYFSIMTIDHKLEVLQPYTNDLDLLRKAIDRVARTEVKDYSGDTAAVEKQLQERLGPNTSGALSQQAQADNLQQQSKVQGHLARLLLTMLQTQQRSASDERGRIDIYALLDAVREQYQLPGRKTVLYFSEGGFVIPQGMEQPFRSVISVANRANVSVYSIDARGLSTFYSPDDRERGAMGANSDAVSSLNNAAQSAKNQANETGRTLGSGEALTAREEGERAKLFDEALESTRSNTQNTLANLAESTGGSLIANTNDLRTPLRRVKEDIQTYYEIAYAPDVKKYDGSFHNVSVKANSSDLRVQSRSGYFALPPALVTAEGNLTVYEVPLLSALSSPQLPHDFDFESVAMHFLGQQNGPVCVLVIDVPFANLNFRPKGTDQFVGQFSYVALLKNDKGEVVKKFRNEIPLTIPSAKMQALKISHFVYTEHFDLAPGHYDVEAAVMDSENGNRISAKDSSLIVSAPSSGLSISSVTFVRNLSDKKASTEANDPLLFGDEIVSPALHPVVAKGSGVGLPFYLVAYGDQKTAAPPKLIMEFSKDGQVLRRASPDIGQPNKEGRIQYIGTVPAASFDPGDYTIRFILQQGTESAEEAAFFKVQ
ncbi:MAG TPA: VWA domain-containing protein [Terriglobales bacterium]|nr:VWA domain-containing protein [Terriglobales bacterium]